MSIPRCGMLFSILSYQLLVIAVAQNACLYSTDTKGICRPYADCKELHHKVIFQNDACEANTYCCPNHLITPPHINNINNYKPELKPNHENPPLPNELIHAIWDEPGEDFQSTSNDNTAFIPAGDNVEIPQLPKPAFNDDWNLNPTYVPEVQEDPNINAPWGNGEQIFLPIAVPGVQVYPEIPQLHNPAFNAIFNSNPTYVPEFQENPNINAPWENDEQIFPPIAVPGIPVQPLHPSVAIPGRQVSSVNDLLKFPDIGLHPVYASTTAVVTESATQTTPKPITTTTTEAIPVFDEEFYRRLGLAFGNKYNQYHQQDVVTPQIDVETSTVDVIIEEVTTNTSSVMNNLNQLGLYKLSSQKCGFVHVENDPSESNTEAHLLEFPWLALLRYESGSRTPNFSCGGSLITERWVLTAASCIRKTLIGVRLGEYKISTKSNKDCVRNSCSVYKDYKIAISVKHADYKPETGVKDIALIKLKARVDMTKNIKTICLPTKVEHFNVPYDNTPLTISGWGLNKTGATEVMKKHAINRSKSRVCQQALPEQRVHQSKLCLTTRHEEPSTCSGDNGGPIIWLVNDNTQFFTQIGVVPFGMDKCGAADGIISAYYVESVADSMEWITKVIGEDE
ncbi:LOW QUALITY PROTEIN: serine protease filzig-like [Bactrocera neohumeralis]|uniref:LOW QUALITY PROTEIN: serine protease filzig-like n=1 Tax=Bactrocera neohumeralis TaxID=98809 RepID=UPI0021655004|nr:LOW QUALITY PROTEIN: serine protease filzig-like [Bactrocera neohumeralis]